MEETKETQERHITVEVRNLVELVGTIDSDIKISHATKDENIYTFILKVPRLRNGVYDYPVIELPERVTNVAELHKGDKVLIKGQFRSFNKEKEIDGVTRTRLILTIFVDDIQKTETNDKVNSVRLKGFVCKKTNFRLSPQGREICDVILAVNRNYRVKTDYLPCVAWGRDARFARDLEIGDCLFIEGRIQSRNYKKRIADGEYVQRTAYEASIFRVRKINPDDVITETYITELESVY